MSNTNGNPLKTKLFAPSFWRSMSLLLAAIVHLGSFVAVLIRLPELGLATVYPGLLFWRIFFAVYCGISTGVVGLAVNQLRNFFNTFDEEECKRREMEGYETIQHSVEQWSDSTIDYGEETLAERRP